MHERTYVFIGVITVLAFAGAFLSMRPAPASQSEETVTATTTSGGTGILPFDSGVLGTVLLGPTCPVVRNPPDARCADKPFATTVNVYAKGSKKVFAALDAKDGTFHFALPPGEYTLSAVSGEPLPRCASVSVTVEPGVFKNADISCDSGIR